MEAVLLFDFELWGHVRSDAEGSRVLRRVTHTHAHMAEHSWNTLSVTVLSAYSFISVLNLVVKDSQALT